jgi:hypothetical protein
VSTTTRCLCAHAKGRAQSIPIDPEGPAIGSIRSIAAHAAPGPRSQAQRAPQPTQECLPSTVRITQLVDERGGRMRGLVTKPTRAIVASCESRAVSGHGSTPRGHRAWRQRERKDGRIVLGRTSRIKESNDPDAVERSAERALPSARTDAGRAVTAPAIHGLAGSSLAALVHLDTRSPREDSNFHRTVYGTVALPCATGANAALRSLRDDSSR